MPMCSRNERISQRSNKINKNTNIYILPDHIDIYNIFSCIFFIQDTSLLLWYLAGTITVSMAWLISECFVCFRHHESTLTLNDSKCHFVFVALFAWSYFSIEKGKLLLNVAIFFLLCTKATGGGGLRLGLGDIVRFANKTPILWE